MRIVLVILLAALFSQPARAVPNMAIWGDDGSGLETGLTVENSTPFDVVVTLNTQGQQAAAAEWVMTELRLEFPGLIATKVKKINDTPLDLGMNDLGEYLLAFGVCESPGSRIELVRITYADIGNAIGAKSTLLTLRGFQPGDTQASSFGGQPGFVDCSARRYGAEMGGHENGGALCLNCYSPPGFEGTFSDLKSRYEGF